MLSTRLNNIQLSSRSLPKEFDERLRSPLNESLKVTLRQGFRVI